MILPDTLIRVQTQLVKYFVIRAFWYQVITQSVETIGDGVMQACATLFVLRVDQCAMSEESFNYASIPILAGYNQGRITELITTFRWTSPLQ